MESRSNKPQDVVKAKQVSQLHEYFTGSQMAIFTDYRGINVEKDTALRVKMRNAGVNYVVAKNTLIKRAYDEINQGMLDAYLEGPTSVAFSNDPVELAKILTAFIKEKKVLAIKAGVLDNQLISATDIEKLSKLPTREVLLAQVAGALQSPMAGFAGVTAGLLRQLVTVTDRIREQKAQEA